MQPRIWFRSCSLVPLSATVRTLRSTLASTSLRPSGSISSRSSNTNIRCRMVSRQVGVLVLDVVQDLPAGRRIETVEHLRHGAYAAVGFAAEFAQGLQLLPDHAGDLEDDLRRDLVQAGHALRDIRAQPGGQRGEQRGRLRGVQVRKHQRDGLRMLVVNELGELLRIGLLDGVEGSGFGAQRFGQAVQHALGHIGTERPHQQLAGVFDAAARDVIAGRRKVVEFVEQTPRPAPSRWP